MKYFALMCLLSGIGMFVGAFYIPMNIADYVLYSAIGLIITGMIVEYKRERSADLLFSKETFTGNRALNIKLNLEKENQKDVISVFEKRDEAIALKEDSSHIQVDKELLKASEKMKGKIAFSKKGNTSSKKITTDEEIKIESDISKEEISKDIKDVFDTNPDFKFD